MPPEDSMETARKIKEAYCYTCTDIVKVLFFISSSMGANNVKLLHFPCVLLLKSCYLASFSM